MQSDAGWEEYYDYIFPEDAANQPNLKLLAMAKMWKRQQIVNKDEEVPEKAPAAEETTSPSDEPAAAPENDSDRNTATEAEQEKTYDDRDDVDSTSSESDSDDDDDDDDDDGKREAKQSKSGDEDEKD